MRNPLINFLPPKIAEVEEFKSIMAVEDLELDNIQASKRRILNEAFIDTAVDYGIKKYEVLYKIRADDLNESLEFRRLRIKNRKMDKAPYTYNFLKHKLENLFGKGNYNLELENDTFTLKVEINTFDWNTFNEIINNGLTPSFWTKPNKFFNFLRIRPLFEY